MSLEIPFYSFVPPFSVRKLGDFLTPYLLNLYFLTFYFLTTYFLTPYFLTPYFLTPYFLSPYFLTHYFLNPYLSTSSYPPPPFFFPLSINNQKPLTYLCKSPENSNSKLTPSRSPRLNHFEKSPNISSGPLHIPKRPVAKSRSSSSAKRV